MKMPIGPPIRSKIDLACPLGGHPLERPVEARPTLGLDLARERIGDVARAARPELERGEILGAPAQPFAHIAAIDDKILPVVRDAAHEDMDVRIVGVPVIDRDPVEPRLEIPCHVGHEVAGETPEVADLPGIFRTDDEAERSEEHTSELQSLMRISYAVFCLKKKKNSIRK